MKYAPWAFPDSNSWSSPLIHKLLYLSSNPRLPGSQTRPLPLAHPHIWSLSKPCLIHLLENLPPCLDGSGPGGLLGSPVHFPLLQAPGTCLQLPTQATSGLGMGSSTTHLTDRTPESSLHNILERNLGSSTYWQTASFHSLSFLIGNLPSDREPRGG